MRPFAWPVLFHVVPAHQCGQDHETDGSQAPPANPADGVGKPRAHTSPLTAPGEAGALGFENTVSKIRSF